MKNSIVLMLKGFFMGIANVIPGVSGGTIAIIVGIYEDFIGAINHLFSNFKRNLKFLIPIVIGIALSILTFSKVIDYSYNNFPIVTTMFFMGLVIGGVPLIIQNIKNCKEKNKKHNLPISVATFLLVVLFAIAPVLFNLEYEVNFDNMQFIEYILLFMVGIIASATMVIPGISGSLVLMLLGYYYPIIKILKSLTDFSNLFSNFIVLSIFGMGILIGIILISKLIEYLFNNFKKTTYYGVIGFIIASIVAIPISTFINVSNIEFSIIEIMIGFVCLVIGGYISYFLGEKE